MDFLNLEADLICLHDVNKLVKDFGKFVDCPENSHHETDSLLSKCICDSGFKDCGNPIPSGNLPLCVHVLSSKQHCGTCENVCSSGNLTVF